MTLATAKLLAQTGIATLALLLVIGCTSEAQKGADTIHNEHVQAKAEIETLYRETIAIVGEDGWGTSEYEWRGCGRSALRSTDSWSRTRQWHGPLSTMI